MTGLAWVQNIALLVHMLAPIGLMVLILRQANKSPRRIHPGFLHIGLTALLAGLVMVGLRTSLHSENPEKWPLLNYGTVGIKFTILMVVLVLGYRNMKKLDVKEWVWIAIVTLITTNILLGIFL